MGDGASQGWWQAQQYVLHWPPMRVPMSLSLRYYLYFQPPSITACSPILTLHSPSPSPSPSFTASLLKYLSPFLLLQWITLMLWVTIPPDGPFWGARKLLPLPNQSFLVLVIYDLYHTVNCFSLTDTTLEFFDLGLGFRLLLLLIDIRSSNPCLLAT